MKQRFIVSVCALTLLSAQSFSSQQPIEGKRQTDVCSTVRGCNYMLQALMSEYNKMQHCNEELLKENATLKKDKESLVVKQVTVCDDAVDLSTANRRSHGNETPEQRKKRQGAEGNTVY